MLRTKNISRKGPRNCRSLHGTPGQVGFARDDKERVVERERAVVKGEGGCWVGRPFSSTKSDSLSG
jgi:hypothetical protein